MRLRVRDLQPAAYQAMMELEKYVAACPVPKRTLDLIKLRRAR
jgi:hypothetical protein